MIVVADLGGSNTDVLLADDAGVVLRSALLPALDPASSPAFLDALLRPLDVSPDDVRTLAVTGGRHRRLGNELAGVSVYPVEEIEAIGRGGLVASGCGRALIVSMGTGTAFVSADGERMTHAAGVALGGGTLRGLSWRLLRTVDAGAIDALAEMGNPRGADLTVADIVGGNVGMLPGEMPAAYFARLAGENPSPADIAAGILDMIGHIAAHMALLTARLHGHDTIVMIGHMLDFAAVRRAAMRFSSALGGEFIVPPEPGLAVARGAVAVVTQPRE